MNMLRALRPRYQALRSTRCLSPRTRVDHRHRHLRKDFYQRRNFTDIHPVLLPPVVFTGLLVTLWTWKCMMMIVFQNKIIYMPGLPYNARREKISDYKNQCGGIQWREEDTRSRDGTRISLCVASVECGAAHDEGREMVYVLYFQGNTSSLPPRLPFLSPILRMLRDAPGDRKKRHTMVCCSYRGYWTSKGRPSEKGIAMDAEAALSWIQQDARNSPMASASLVIWGQSIGAGVATTLVSKQGLSSADLPLRTLILETPFLSIRSLLETLYPEKWLPYRYLWPFLRNHLDSLKALGILADQGKELGAEMPQILILDAGKDELVPKIHGEMLERRCRELNVKVKRKVVRNALHTEVMVRHDGRIAVVEAILESAGK